MADDRREREIPGSGAPSAVQPNPSEVERLREEVRRLREEQDRQRSALSTAGNGGGASQGTSNQTQAPQPSPTQKPENTATTDQDNETPRRPWYRDHPIKALLALIVIVAIAVGAFWYWQYSQTFESTDDAQIDGHLNAVSTRIPGTIKALYFVENQEVKAGQLLAELDPRDYEVTIEQAQAALAQARAGVQVQAPSLPITAETTQSGIASSQAEVATAQAGVAAAQQQYESQLARLAREEANNQKAQADLQRYTTLVQKDEVSRQQYDQQVAAAKAAQANVESERAAAEAAKRVIEQRRAQLNQAQTQLGEVQANAPRQLSIQRANVALRHAGTQAAQAQLTQARLNLEYTKVYAPVAGVIGRKAAEIGMRVQPGQQLTTIVPLNDIWVTANFKETQLRKMRVNQGATIHVDALDRDFDAYVESMPAATAARYSILPPENASGNYVKVVQRLPVRLRFKDPGSAHGLLRPGMSVVPKVWLQ